MKVTVFGLGYVGCVSAACLTELGHSVVGVDVNSKKVERIAAGAAPMIEPRLNDVLTRGVTHGRLAATGSAAEALEGAEAILICVGTPSNGNGSLDVSHIDVVASEIGRSLDRCARYPVVIVRSTVPPGSMRGRVIPALEQSSGRVSGRDFGVCLNPEFLREGSAVADFFAPPFTLVGELEPRSGDAAAALYAGIDAALIRTDIDLASMVKYASNAYHALKIVFANEIGALCREMGVDSQEVMRIFCLDDKLNTSPAYLRPGFAFGGSCLPKDLRALLYQARRTDVELPVLGAVFRSNDVHLERAVDVIVAEGRRRIGVVGLSFKPGTDDLRESPLVRLIERLLGKGFDIRIYDKDVSLGLIFGANREYIERMVPHLASLMCESLDELLGHAEVVVIGKRSSALDGLPIQNSDGSRVVVDLTGWTARGLGHASPTNLGIC